MLPKSMEHHLSIKEIKMNAQSMEPIGCDLKITFKVQGAGVGLMPSKPVTLSKDGRNVSEMLVWYTTCNSTLKFLN